MKFTTSIIAAIATMATFSLAAPTPDSDVSVARAEVSAADGAPIKKRTSCGHDNCGECNGTSCKLGGVNHGCSVGSCTAQSGAGDGASCGYDNSDYKWFLIGTTIYCPGN